MLTRLAHLLKLKARSRVTELFMGNYKSHYQGSGMEFDEYREYVVGDDVRLLDFKVSARFDKPFVKIHKEEHDQTLVIAIDVSSSMSCGEPESKIHAVGQILALLGLASTMARDRLSVIFFTADTFKIIPPGRSYAHYYRVMREFENTIPLKLNQSSGLKILSQKVQAFFKRRVRLIILSDFCFDAEKEIKILRRRFDLDLIQIHDKNPIQDLPFGFFADVTDSETGKTHTQTHVMSDEFKLKERHFFIDITEDIGEQIFLQMSQGYQGSGKIKPQTGTTKSLAQNKRGVL